MTSFPYACRGMLALSAIAILLASCNGPHSYVRAGDANSVEVSFSGDVDSTLPLARNHCAEYAKVPQMVAHGLDSAVYDCVNQ